FTGFDNGARNTPAPLKAAMNSGNLIVTGPNFSTDQIKGLTASLLNAPTALIQRNNDIPANFSLDSTAGTSVDIGDDRFGVIAALSWDNSWQTRGGIQQLTSGIAVDDNGNDAILPEEDYRFMS